MSYRRNNNENEKYGFVYLWYDIKHKRYYVGCHWGTEDDGYICSSSWMRQAHRIRPQDFRRRIIKTNITTREDTYIEEQRYLGMIRPEELRIRYYNLNIKNNEVWHKYPEAIKSVGEKISYAKKGKQVGPMTEERKLKISQAKKEAFAARGGMTEEHKRKIKEARIGLKRSEESKQKTSNTLKDKWKNEWQDRKITPKETMSRAEQDALCSMQLKERWADPVWAANQRARLSEGAKNRPPRSEESKLKASLAQKGKSKKKA
jgi:hypothetical protein